MPIIDARMGGRGEGTKSALHAPPQRHSGSPVLDTFLVFQAANTHSHTAGGPAIISLFRVASWLRSRRTLATGASFLSVSSFLFLFFFPSQTHSIRSGALDHHEEPGGAAGPNITTRRFSLLFFFKQSCRSHRRRRSDTHARRTRVCVYTWECVFTLSVRLSHSHSWNSPKPRRIIARARARASERAPVRFLLAARFSTPRTRVPLSSFYVRKGRVSSVDGDGRSLISG